MAGTSDAPDKETEGTVGKLKGFFNTMVGDSSYGHSSWLGLVFYFKSFQLWHDCLADASVGDGYG
jgi:hypothetical protein